MISIKKEKKKGKGVFIFICILAFIISFFGSAIFKITYKPKWAKKYTVDWNDSIGKIHKDISYGYKFADGNIGVGEDGIITLPLYMIAFI